MKNNDVDRGVEKRRGVADGSNKEQSTEEGKKEEKKKEKKPYIYIHIYTSYSYKAWT